LQSDIGILDSVLDELFEGHLADAALLGALFPDQLGNRNRAVPEQGLRQVVEAPPHVGNRQEGGDHGVEQLPPDLDAVPQEGDNVEFQVVADLGDLAVFEDRAEFLEHRGSFLARHRKGHVEPGVGLEGNGDTGDVAGFGVEPGGL
jgi:hypothetical protein